MSNPVQITLDTESGHELCLRLAFPSATLGPHSRPMVDGVIHITQQELSLDYGFVCFGHDVRAFAESLAQLHASLDGTAAFVNSQGTVQVTVAVADRARGRLHVRVRLESCIRSPQPGEPLYSRVALDGFDLEQSHVPHVVGALYAFLRQAGVATIHPMAPGR